MTYHHAIACLGCNAIGHVGRHGASFYNSFESQRLCSACGERHGWRDVVVHWAPAHKTLNPMTWFSGSWVNKEEAA